MIISLILGLVMGALAVVFALQNNFPVTVSFLNWEFTSSLAVITVLSVLSGILITLFLSLPGAVKNSFAISKLKRENRKLADDIESLRASRRETTHVIHTETPSGPGVI